MLTMEQVEALEIAFKAERHRAMRMLGWRRARHDNKLLEQLRGLCSESPREGDEEAREKLAAIAETIALRLSPTPTKKLPNQGGQLKDRCPLASALESGSLGVAEALWRGAPQSWWQNGEALAQAAKGQDQTLHWIEKLLPSWSGGGRNPAMESLIVGRLARVLIAKRGIGEIPCENLWQAMLDKLSSKEALRVASLVSGWGAGFEDWGRNASAKSPGSAGGVFEAATRYSNSTGFDTVQKGAWSAEFLAELAQSASRPQLLFAMAWPRADKAHAGAAQSELDRRCESGVGRGDAEMALKILEECESVESIYASQGLNYSIAQKLRRDAMEWCRPVDPFPVARALIEASRGTWGWKRLLPWPISARERERNPQDFRDRRLAQSIAALARIHPLDVGSKLRSIAGLENGAFDPYFVELTARQEAVVLLAACAELPPAINKPRRSHL